MVKKPSQNESLLVVNEAAGLYVPRDFEGQAGEGAAVNRIEQKIHLVNCLTHLAGAKMLSGVIQIGSEGKILDRYGSEATGMVIASEQKRVNNLNQAKWEFAWATGRFALEDSGVMTAEEARRLTAGMFSDFLRIYYLPTDPRDRNLLRHQLETDVQKLQLERTEHNRKQALRPHNPKTKPTTAEATPKEEGAKLEALNTQSKLEAILEDPRAGFLPTTHREKNTVIAYLDYLDNPDYPLGINNQFFEVVAHKEKTKPAVINEKGEVITPRQKGSVEAGIRAVESIVWEIGDYMNDAAKSYESLSNLRRSLIGISPDIKVGDEVGSEHAGLVPLVRFMNLMEYLKIGKIAGLKRDPLRTAKDRWQSGNEPGKHKTVYDQYTKPNRKPAFEKYIQDKISTMMVREATAALDKAIANELKRREFMKQRLQDAGLLEGYLAMAQVSDAVKQSIGVLDDVA